MRPNGKGQGFFVAAVLLIGLFSLLLLGVAGTVGMKSDIATEALKQVHSAMESSPVRYPEDDDALGYFKPRMTESGRTHVQVVDVGVRDVTVNENEASVTLRVVIENRYLDGSTERMQDTVSLLMSEYDGEWVATHTSVNP